jgi:hypothetical protein
VLTAGVDPIRTYADSGLCGAHCRTFTSGATADDPDGQTRSAAFLQGLEQLGWIDDRNIRIDYRWGAGDADGMRKYAAELVTLAPDVIVASGTATVAPLLQIAWRTRAATPPALPSSNMPSRRAALSPMGRTSMICSVAPLSTSTESCRGPSRPTCRWNSRLSSNS